MGFFIKDGTRLWCGDLRWKQYPRKPSFRTIRHDALAMGMTHFVRTPRLPNRIGYLKLDQKGEKISPDSLLLSVAEHFGTQYFGEYEVGPDQHWLVATDDAGVPLLGSDGIYTSEEIDAVKTSFAGHTFTRKAILSEDEFNALQKALPPAPVSLRSISLRRFYIVTSATCVSILVSVQVAHLIQQHRLEEMRLAAQKALLQNTHPVKPPPPVIPGDWIRTCLRAAGSFPIFNGGWTLAHWECAQHDLAITWQRSGGTLASAPGGEIQDGGDTVISHVLLDVPAGDAGLYHPSRDERQFLAFMQNAGATLTTARPSTDAVRKGAGGYVAALAVTFTWQSNPQDIPWNDFLGLHIMQMSRVVTSAARTGSRNAASGGYQFQVILDSTANPDSRHRGP